jgi:hypothetical protein
MPRLVILYQSRERVERKVRTRDLAAGIRKSRRLTYPRNFIGEIPTGAMILAHAEQSI